MSTWKRVKHHIDKTLGMHIFYLEESQSGAEHRLQIEIGHDSCFLCGHVIPKDNLGKIDPYEFERRELAALQFSHDNMDLYAKRTATPIRRKR